MFSILIASVMCVHVLMCTHLFTGPITPQGTGLLCVENIAQTTVSNSKYCRSKLSVVMVFMNYRNHLSIGNFELQ